MSVYLFDLDGGEMDGISYVTPRAMAKVEVLNVLGCSSKLLALATSFPDVIESMSFSEAKSFRFAGPRAPSGLMATILRRGSWLPQSNSRGR